MISLPTPSPSKATALRKLVRQIFNQVPVLETLMHFLIPNFRLTRPMAPAHSMTVDRRGS